MLILVTFHLYSNAVIYLYGAPVPEGGLKWDPGCVSVVFFFFFFVVILKSKLSAQELQGLSEFAKGSVSVQRDCHHIAGA